MKRRGIILTILLILTIVGCSENIKEETSREEKEFTYMQVSAEQAKEMMDTEEGYLILDVRTQEEHDASYIPGAICIPNEEITDTQPELLPDKDQKIFIYCRSGNRSKQAAKKLAAMGYKNIVEFGGINSWPYDVSDAGNGR